MFVAELLLAVEVKKITVKIIIMIIIIMTKSKYMANVLFYSVFPKPAFPIVILLLLLCRYGCSYDCYYL